MVSKKLASRGTKRGSNALVSTENLATKTGMNNKNGAVKNKAGAVAEDPSLIILADASKVSWSDELRDQFVELQQFYHLHPKGAEETLFSLNQASSKKKWNDAMEKLQMIKRVERALKEGIREISTYEFFGFSDAMAPSLFSEISCSIYLVGFENDKLIRKEPIFVGSLSCNAKKVKHNVNVVYHPLSKYFEDKATDGFLVAEVTVEYAPTGGQSQSTRRRRSSVGNAVAVAQGQRTIFGCRKIFERCSDDGSIEMKFCNSAIHMSADSVMPPNWDADHKCVSALAAKLETDAACVRLPSIAFELTDQHCEENWEEIKQRMEWREERMRVESQKQHRYVIYKEQSASSISSSSSSSSMFNTSDSSKENEGLANPTPVVVEEKMETESETDAEVLLAEIVENRCPFCLHDQDNSESLIVHLIGRYPFDFRNKDDVIEVGAMDTLGALIQGSTEVEPPKPIKSDKVGILRDELPPFIMPKLSPNPYPTVAKDCVLVDHYSEWKEFYNAKEIDEYIDHTTDESIFMKWVNSHTLNYKEPLQGQNQKEQLMKHLADRLVVEKPLPWEKSYTFFYGMVFSLYKSNTITLKVFTDIVCYAYILKY